MAVVHLGEYELYFHSVSPLLLMVAQFLLNDECTITRRRRPMMSIKAGCVLNVLN